jgi:cell wall-associated NlpC family hydrolase
MLSSWGLVRVSVADVHREPDHKSEQVTQAIMGMALEILDQRRNWRYVRLPDGYLGWVSESLLQLGEEKLIQRWQASSKLMVTSQVALILSRRQSASIPVSDAVIGTQLLRLETGQRWHRVALPDGRQGWIAHRDTADVGNIIHLEGGSAEQILKTAHSFMGFPYLWGGTTPKGFDCSGFVQTVFRLNGLSLPRDSSQQFTQGREVSQREQLRPADLVFFKAQDADRIVHVAIHIQKSKFIHCSGYVRINSLEQSAEDYDASLEAQYAGAKRLIGGFAGQC